MGVSTNFYTYYGIKIPYSSDFSESYEEMYDHPDCPDILFDGMDGEYIVFGIRLFDSGDARYGFEAGDQFKEIDLSNLTNLEEKYKAGFKEFFPNFAKLMD